MATPGAPAIPVLAVAMTAGIAAAHPAPAQEVSLNYESLSSLEEPLATEVGDVTLVLTGLVDVALIRNTGDDDDIDAGLVGNFQIGALDPAAEPLAGRADVLRAVCGGRAF